MGKLADNWLTKNFNQAFADLVQRESLEQVLFRGYKHLTERHYSLILHHDIITGDKLNQLVDVHHRHTEVHLQKKLIKHFRIISFQ